LPTGVHHGRSKAVIFARPFEEEDQRAYLEDNGCTEGQGYLFSKAVPATEIAALLSARSEKAEGGLKAANSA
jgi:hypothetical protein